MKSLILLVLTSSLLVATTTNGCLLSASTANSEWQRLVPKEPEIKVLQKGRNSEIQSSPFSTTNKSISPAVFNFDIHYSDDQQIPNKNWPSNNISEMKLESIIGIVMDQRKATRTLRF